MIDESRYRVYCCKDGRVRCYDRETKRVVSYPRVLMESKLGRPLESYEHVHHIDENPLNNDLDNLEVLHIVDHERHHSIKYTNDIIVNCVYCNREIVLSPKRQRSRVAESKRGKYGPFCSRRCSGKYGKQEQLRRNAMVK